MTSAPEPSRRDYDLAAALPDSWRAFDERHPDPGYFEFDSLSACHPDLYHRFALSTVALMNEMELISDLSNKVVVDIGAGTGRSTIAAGRKAGKVIAVDAYKSVAAFGEQRVREAGLLNVAYVRADLSCLPFGDATVDVVLSAWAEVNKVEAYRVLKPGGHLFDMACAPGAVCGELTTLLRRGSREIPEEWFDPACPSKDSRADASMWGGIPLVDGVHLHDFTRDVDYGDVHEAAAILRRLWGPLAGQYMLDRNQSKLMWRLRIEYGRVSK